MAGEGELQQEIQAVGQWTAETGSRWRMTFFENRRVYLRDDLFDLAKKTPDGRSNAERMQGGDPPLDRAGAPVELHHMLQQEPGPVAEVASDFHKANHGILHIDMMKNPSASRKRYEEIRPRTAFRIPSGIDRTAFDAFRRRYWKWRATVVP